jgi:hypothetical protein
LILSVLVRLPDNELGLTVDKAGAKIAFLWDKVNASL